MYTESVPIEKKEREQKRNEEEKDEVKAKNRR
jgi:hypothetical protein